jgi:hypothetical protein
MTYVNKAKGKKMRQENYQDKKKEEKAAKTAMMKTGNRTPSMYGDLSLH